MIKIIQIAIWFDATLNVTRGFAVFFFGGGRGEGILLQFSSYI